MFSVGPFIVTQAWRDKLPFKSKEGKEEKQEMTSLAASWLTCSRGVFIRAGQHSYINRRTALNAFIAGKDVALFPTGFRRSLVKYYSASQMTTGCWENVCGIHWKTFLLVRHFTSGRQDNLNQERQRVYVQFNYLYLRPLCFSACIFWKSRAMRIWGCLISPALPTHPPFSSQFITLVGLMV